MTDQVCRCREYRDQIEDLRVQLDEAKETLRAIRSGEVDALVIAGPEGNQIFTLKGAESTYRVLVEAMNEGALVLTPDGTVMYSNGAFSNMVGVPLERVIGSRIHRFVHDSDLETIDELLREGQGSEAKREIDLINASTDETAPAQMSVASLPVGEANGMSAVLTDLTEHKRAEAELETYREHLEDLVEERTKQLMKEIEERKRTEQALRESEARFRAVFESTQDAIVVVDDNGVYVDANPAVEAVFGVRPDQLIGRTVRDFMMGYIDQNAEWAEFLRTGRSKVSPSVVRPDGSVREVEGSSVANIQPGRHLSVLHDVTERAQAERAVVAAKETAEEQTRLLQRALIPASPPIIEGYPIASAYIPALVGTDIGGDFLDVFRTEDGKIGVLIGDVAGKGIESAAMAASTRSTIRAFAYDSSSPAEALTHANSVLSAQQDDYMQFVTAFLVVLDPTTGEIICSDAGHPPAIVSGNGDCAELSCTPNIPLGIMGDIRYDEDHSTLKPGDCLVLYTDGVTEARYDRGLFGADGVMGVLSMHPHASPGELVEEILDAVRSWAHGQLRDDTAVLVIRRDK